MFEREEIARRVAELAADALGEELEMDGDFAEAGINSVEVITFMGVVEDQLGVEIWQNADLPIRTLDALVEHIFDNQGESRLVPVATTSELRL